jgi:hypothetical protein
MILASLALATTLAVAIPPQAEPMPNLYSQPAHCKSVVEREVSRQRTAFRGQVPAAQYAVARSLDGCAVPTPVGYHPGYLQPGKANPPPATREDGPSNRR